MHEAWGNDNLDLVLVEAEVLEDLGGEGAGEVDASIALPVSSDKQLSHFDGFSSDVRLLIVNLGMHLAQH